MQASSPTLSVKQVLICGAMIVTLSMGIRHGFGLWLQPITQAQDWSRQTFSFALAVQNLSWGIFGVFAGMVADRFGAFRVLIAGTAFYALGLLGMAYSPTPLLFTLSAGVLIGAAQAGTTYAVVYGVIEGLLIRQLGWQSALAAVAMLALVIMPLAFGLREPQRGALAGHRDQSVLQAVGEAFRYPSFGLLMAGYFVCGFQLAFIGIHMPTYLRDQRLPAEVAGYALALIGLFNVFGTYTVGLLGQKLAKRKILAAIYFARAVSIALFLLAPISPLSVYVFSAAMGFLWLSTVPATNAIIAGIFGVAHLSMLSGFVFLSHQVGSFIGVWLGGYLYDTTGSYDIVWYIAIALGVFAALINLPVKESAIARAGRPAAMPG
jgi:MFS family permease